MLEGEETTPASLPVVLEGIDYADVAIDDVIAKANILEDASKNYAVKKDYTLSDDYTSVSKTVKIDTTMPGVGADTVVTLTLQGIDTTPDVTKDGTKKIQFETYTYSFETPVYDVSGDASVLSGEVKGYLIGYTMDVVLANNIATSATVASSTAKFILPEDGTGVSVALDDEDITAATLLNFMNVGTYTDAVAYASYREGLIGKDDNSTGYRQDIDEFVQTLVGTNSIFKTLNNDINASTKPDGMSVEFTGSATSGTAKITYTVPATETAAVSVAGLNTGKELRLAPGDKVEITLNSKANTNATEGFDVDTFTITGTFQAYDTDSKATTFEEVYDVTVNGKVTNKMSVAVTGSTFKSLTLDSTTAPTFAITTGSAKADIAVGPAIRTDEGHLGEFVVEPVTVEYKD